MRFGAGWTSSTDSVRGAGVLLALLLAACGGSDSTAPYSPPPPTNRAPTVPTLSYANSQLAMLAGEEIPLTASALDADGDSVTFAWQLTTTTGGTLSAAAGPSSTWTAGAGGNGTDTIVVTASDGQLSSSTTLSFALGTPVGGSLIVDTVWTAADSPYVLTDNVRVEAGTTLTLQPGVQLLLRKKGVAQDKTALQIAGTLVAVGGTSIAQQIVVKGATSTPLSGSLHQGIVFLSGGSGTLAYVRVERGDAGVDHKGTAPLSIYSCRFTQCIIGVRLNEGSNATIRRTLVDQSSGDGVFVGDANVILRESTLRRGGGAGLRLNPSDPFSTLAHADVDSCNFDNNDSYAIVLKDSSVATVFHCNLLPEQNEKDLQFSGEPGIANSTTLDFRTCYWGFLVSTNDPVAAKNEIAVHSIEGHQLRTFEVYPYTNLAVLIPGAP